MKYTNRIIAIVALSAIVPTAYSGSLNDSIATGDILTADLLNNAKAAINDNDSRTTALETADGVINGKVTALETEDGFINGKVTALEAADDDMNVRVSILEGQPKAKVGFGDPSSSTDGFITGSEIGTVYIDIVPEDVYMSVAIVSGTAIWKQLTPKKYSIGDVGPAGGWVFYVTGDGLHGLEAAPVDQVDATWGCSFVAVVGAEGLRIGRGARNTGDILAGCADANTAADLADAYTLNGYVDWYLPSRDELNEMYSNIGQGATPAPNVGGFASNVYWSSSEFNDNGAWAQVFNSGNQGSDNKFDSNGVRAVRAF